MKMVIVEKNFSFRLLNSEIGNDHHEMVFNRKDSQRFRLLNSEIGNDQSGFFNAVEIKARFSSP